MSFIKIEEIRGYRFEPGILCLRCNSDIGMRIEKQTEIITSEEVKNADGLFFCDRCAELL